MAVRVAGCGCYVLGEADGSGRLVAVVIAGTTLVLVRARRRRRR
jgi:hypothetical protein